MPLALLLYGMCLELPVWEQVCDERGDLAESWMLDSGEDDDQCEVQ